MKNCEVILLYHETGSPISEMWPDQNYADIMNKRVVSVVEQIMASHAIASNGLNIFSAEGDLPVHVSYPSFSLAKQLAREYADWIEKLKNGITDPEHLIRSYTFNFNRVEKGFVSPLNQTMPRIRTGTVIFSYLTPVQTILGQL